MARQILPNAAESSVMMRYEARHLTDYAKTLLMAGGYSTDHAHNTAEVLVWANARGADSHGVLRIPRYIEMVEQGTIHPTATPVTEAGSGAMTVMDAKRAPGSSAMNKAMDVAISLADQNGVGWCAVRNITHSGAIGFYALKAAQNGCVGIVLTASGPLMAYHGSRVSGLSTNPISIAAPSTHGPLLLDMSTSTVALGKIMHAKDAGHSIPHGWGIDGQGRPATDPNQVATLTPLGGAKGSGLSLMIEILASVLIANPVISVALSGDKPPMNGAVLALKIDNFSDQAAFVRHVANLIKNLKSLPVAEGTEEILMPGERGFRLSEKRMAEGIPLAEGTVLRLAEISKRFGITPLSAMGS